MRKDWILVLAIMVVAVLLRAPLLHTGLSIDDACTVFVIEAPTLSELVERIRTIEMSPPLYFATVRAVTSVLGLTTPVLAGTSLFFSVAVIPLIYLLGRSCARATPATPDNETAENTEDKSEAINQTSDTRPSRVGLCAALFAATSMLSIIYSHEARTYAVAGFLLTISLNLFVGFFDGKWSLKRRIGLFFSTAAAAYTHYTTVPYTGIMILTALIYRKKGPSRSLHAIPYMVAGLALLAPWYPVMKYHGSVGTPWADPTPATKFLNVLDTNLAAASPLPVVASFFFITAILPAILGMLLVIKPWECVARVKEFFGKPKLVVLFLLLFYSASTFGYITPYIFGYVRYMYPISVTAWVLLAVAVVSLIDWANSLPRLSKLPPALKKAVLILALLIPIGASAYTVHETAATDRSGLRQLAKDMVAGRFKNAAYITSPDFVGIILVYYLKHECGLSAANLPRIIGFAYPEGGILPPKHEGRAAVWHVPHLFENYAGYLDDLQKEGKEEVVLVRDTYAPDSKQIPTGTLTNKLEELLATKMQKVGETQTYKGSASTYKVTRYQFRKAANPAPAP